MTKWMPKANNKWLLALRCATLRSWLIDPFAHLKLDCDYVLNLFIIPCIMRAMASKSAVAMIKPTKMPSGFRVK